MSPESLSVVLTLPRLAIADGGPPVVVQELGLALAELGVRVEIVTGPSPPTMSHAPAHPRLRMHQRSLTRGLMQWPAFSPHQVVHDFGLWRWIHHRAACASWRQGVPYLNSPCGMLAPWAWAQKTWKKQIAWVLYQRRHLNRAAVLVASSNQELRQLRRQFPRKAIACIPHGVYPPPETPGTAQDHCAQRTRTALFVGRLHPVKGLSQFLRAWAHLRPAGWRCRLAGPDSGGHQLELQRLLMELGCAADVEFLGQVDADTKWNLLRQADLFVLPSLSESFGLAVAEALAAGVPVLTTNATPWAQLAAAGCGWVVPPSPPHLVTALREAVQLTDPQRHAMGARGRELVRKEFAWPTVASQFVSVYDWILCGGPRPACVNLA